MKLKQIILFITCVLCVSCHTNKTIVSDEQAYRHEVTTSYPLFFNAENARVMGDTKLALALYTDYVKKYPQNSTALFNLARLQLQKMEIVSAEKNAKKAFQLNPSNSYFEEFYAQLLVLNKKRKEAELQYESLIKKYPRDEDYMYSKAVLHLMSAEYEKAIQTFEQMESITGFSEDIIEQKKNIYLKIGKIDKAIAEIQKLKDDDKSTPQYDIMMAEIYAAANMKEKEKEVYSRIEKEFHEDARAQVALAQYYSEQRNKAKHNEYMQLVMKNKNLNVETKMAMMFPALRKLESDSSGHDDVIQMAKSLAEQSSGNSDAQSLYADVLYFSGKREDALTEYKKYLAIDKKKFTVWNQILSIHAELQQFDSVVVYGEQSISLFPKNSLAYFYTGISYQQLHQVEKAIDLLSKGVNYEKDNKPLQVQYFSSLGDAYNSNKNFTQSDSCFDKALAIDSNDASVLNNYAYYLSVRKERLHDAERMSKRSLELQPKSPSFLDTYGWILFQQEKYNEALKYIQQAIEVNERADGTLYEHLGDVQFKLGQTKEAIESWKKANAKGENNPILLKKIQDGKYYE